jgi:hypothetical protein
MEEKMVFKPRPSIGWISLSALTFILLAAGVSAILSSDPNPVFSIIFIVLGIYFALLVLWWPTMRYELDREALTLLYGKAIKYRIPLDTIRSMQRVDLGLSLWSSVRMPGVALFGVRYSDVGRVQMCSTAALQDIFLIKTEHGLYGITPADEDRFAAEVEGRIGR